MDSSIKVYSDDRWLRVLTDVHLFDLQSMEPKVNFHQFVFCKTIYVAVKVLVKERRTYVYHTPFNARMSFS